MPSFNLISCKLVKGRKDYKCVWCAEPIEKGLSHNYRAYQFEGFQTDRWHIECHEAQKSYDWLENDNSFCEGDFQRGTIEEKRHYSSDNAGYQKKEET